MFTVCLLTFGDHLPLAQRCLNSIVASADWSLIREIRIGRNEISNATAEYLAAKAREIPVPVLFFEERYGRNVGKYPLMRRIFYDRDLPVTTERVMWFDDDSFVRPPQLKSWWGEVARLAERADFIGPRYHIFLTPSQWRAVQAQPWYNRVPPPTTRKAMFFQGGWWVSRFELLKRWDYPFPELYHNGGDVMLGELLRQQDIRREHFNTGVAANADEAGVESKALRRGLTTTPLWRDYVPGRVPVLDHQEFSHIVAVAGNARGLPSTLDRPLAEPSIGNPAGALPGTSPAARAEAEG